MIAISIIDSLGLTKVDEIDCERCVTVVAALTERELAGRPVDAGPDRRRAPRPSREHPHDALDRPTHNQEPAQAIAFPWSARTTKFYDRAGDESAREEVEQNEI
jgi:hypothetical protein